MKVDEIPLLDAGQCEWIVKRINGHKQYWMDRGTFYTLGAATYQDDPKVYPTIARLFNPILIKTFDPLYHEVFAALDRLKASPVVNLSDTAMPSFHIIDSRANGVEGSIHVDEPYERIDWGQPFRDPFSFTMLVSEPECGAGLNYWLGCTDDVMAAYEVDHAIPEPDYMPYKLGVLYVHDGMTPHQMANPGDLKPGEQRITLQGHGVTLMNGTIAVYF